jgi:hypothetical protein
MSYDVRMARRSTLCRCAGQCHPLHLDNGRFYLTEQGRTLHFSAARALNATAVGPRNPRRSSHGKDAETRPPDRHVAQRRSLVRLLNDFCRSGAVYNHRKLAASELIISESSGNDHSRAHSIDLIKALFEPRVRAPHPVHRGFRPVEVLALSFEVVECLLNCGCTCSPGKANGI